MNIVDVKGTQLKEKFVFVGTVYQQNVHVKQINKNRKPYYRFF